MTSKIKLMTSSKILKMKKMVVKNSNVISKAWRNNLNKKMVNSMKPVLKLMKPEISVKKLKIYKMTFLTKSKMLKLSTAISKLFRTSSNYQILKRMIV